MNILMVGHSGAGKTSFMAGMYKNLGDAQEGYGIRAKDSTQKKNLERMAQNLSVGQYPSGTDIQQMYRFELTCAGKDVVPFNWMDYRGGILLSEDPDDEDMDNFLKSISSADALVVFLDGEKLSEQTSEWTMEYDILISCIENSLSIEHKSWFPICFVITKCDMLPEGASFYGLKHFYTLFEQISQSKTVGGMLLQCSINPFDYYTPFLALAYCIYGGTPIYIQKRNDAKNNAAYRAQKHTPETLIGWFAVGIEEVLNGVVQVVNDDWGWETELDKANSANHDFEREKAQLEFLKAIAEELKYKLIEWSENGFVQLFNKNILLWKK